MGYLKLFRKRKYPSVSKDWGFALKLGIYPEELGLGF
jgi:hypothetical protein